MPFDLFSANFRIVCSPKWMPFYLFSGFLLPKMDAIWPIFSRFLEFFVSTIYWNHRSLWGHLGLFVSDVVSPVNIHSLVFIHRSVSAMPQDGQESMLLWSEYTPSQTVQHAGLGVRSDLSQDFGLWSAWVSVQLSFRLVKTKWVEAANALQCKSNVKQNSCLALYCV